MENSKLSVINLVLIIFFIHGVLYFIYPEQVYDNASSIKLIKYFLISFLIIICFFKIHVQKMVVFIVVFILLVGANYLAGGFKNSLTGILYIIPFIVVLLMHEVIFKKANLFFIVLISYLCVSIFGYIDSVQETFFSRFGYGLHGYRISSILTNPNNLGLCLLFSTIFIFKKMNKNIYSVILIANTSILLYFSFSKTSMVLFLIYLFVRYIKTLFVCIPIIFLLVTYYVLENHEELLTSLVARFEYNNMFFNIAQQNLIAPFFNNYQYTDNVYLNLYGTFSIFILILFIIFNQFILISLCLKKYFKHILYLSLFLIAGLSENFLYLFPLAYIYWGYIFWLLNYKLKINCCVKNKNSIRVESLGNIGAAVQS